MKKIFAIALISFLGFSASAYQDGTYNCKNRNVKLPDNVYKVQTTNVGGLSVPYVEATLYYFSTSGDTNSAIESSHLRGFASTVSTKNNQTTLQLSALNLSFDGDTFLNCKP